MKRINITPAANWDADEIFAYIAGDNPYAAEEQIQRIFTASKRLADFPESGRTRPEIGPGARTIVVGRYLLLYRVGRDSVTYCALFTAHANCRASSTATRRWRSDGGRSGDGHLTLLFLRQVRPGWAEPDPARLPELGGERG